MNLIQSIFFVGFGIYQSIVPFTIGFPWPLSSVERSNRNPGHLFRQGCPSWYVWQCLFVDIFGCRIEYALHTCQVSVFVTPVQVFIPVPCYTSFRYLRGQRACFLLAAWTRTIPIFSSPICNTIWKSKNQNNWHWQCDTDYDV